MNKTLIIDYDDSPECPMDNDGAWTLVPFNRDSIHRDDPYKYLHPRATPDDPEPANIGIRRKLAVGLAFWLSYFKHGEGHYSLKGEGTQCPWDTTRLAGVLLWNHPPGDMGAKTYEDRAKDARAFLDEYNAWANGHVYYFAVEDEAGNTPDSCGGFYDVKWMTERLAGSLKPGDRVVVTGQAAFLIDKSNLPDGVEIVDEFEEAEV